MADSCSLSAIYCFFAALFFRVSVVLLCRFSMHETSHKTVFPCLCTSCVRFLRGMSWKCQPCAEITFCWYFLCVTFVRSSTQMLKVALWLLKNDIVCKCLLFSGLYPLVCWEGGSDVLKSSVWACEKLLMSCQDAAFDVAKGGVLCRCSYLSGGFLVWFYLLKGVETAK